MDTNKNIETYKIIMDLSKRVDRLEMLNSDLVRHVVDSDTVLYNRMIADPRIPDDFKIELKQKIDKNIKFLDECDINDFKDELEDLNPDDLDK